MLHCASICGSFYFQQACILPLKGIRVYLRTFRAILKHQKNIAKVLSICKLRPHERTSHGTSR